MLRLKVDVAGERVVVDCKSEEVDDVESGDDGDSIEMSIFKIVSYFV
jgi:hypothetical protein